MIYDLIFIYCNLVSSRWRWSVNSYTNSEETAIYQRRRSTQNNTRTQNTQKDNEHTKQENVQKILETTSRVIRK
jgi:Skp family chaperone for outer membrane proteins